MSQKMMAVALGAVLGLSAMTGVASAQSQLTGRVFDPSREAPPLNIHKRPFTDSGTAVPLNYEHSYLSNETTLRRPVYSSFTPDRYGQDVLPRPFDGLGLY